MDYGVSIRWGCAATESVEYSFKSEAELDAFLHGVDEGAGWMDYRITQERRPG